MTTPLVSIVVPSSSGHSRLERCLSALSTQRFSDFETIVVDNAPEDRALELLHTRFPEATVISLEGNAGFAGAANAGALAAQGRYVAILNDDVEVAADWLAELVACLERHPAAAAVTGKVRRLADPQTLDGAGDCMTWSLKAYRRGLGERDRGQYDAEEEVFSASGTACLWRTEVFRELGGYDESFYAYYDDVDLGFRARLAGYECWYTPLAVALHESHGTTRARWREFDSLHSVRNRWATIVKDAPASWLIRSWPRLVLGELLSLGRAAATGNLPLVIRAYGQAARALPAWRSQRRTIQGGRRATLSSFRPVVRRGFPPARMSFRRLSEAEGWTRPLRQRSFRVAQRVWRALPHRVRDLLRPILLPAPMAPATVFPPATPRPRQRPRQEETSGPPTSVSVVVPTLNAGPQFARVLDSIRRQQGVDVELVIVDSGSTDGTAELALANGARVEWISPGEFSHGGTRNLGAELTSGEMLAMMAQDAILLGRTAFLDLARELKNDPELAAVSARQIPRSDADLYGAFVTWAHYRALWPQSDKTQPELLARRAELTMDNVCAVIRRSAWEELRFAEVDFAEDLEFAARARAAGWRLGLSTSAAVAHSHTRDALYHLRRSVADRLTVAPLVDDRRLSRAAKEPLEQIFSAAHEFLPRVEGALRFGPEPGSLADHLRVFASELSGARPASPTGNLARLDEFVAARNGAVSGEVLTRVLQQELLAQLRWEPLEEFSRLHGSVSSAETADFLTKTAGAVIGRALGDSIRYRGALTEADVLLEGV